MSDVVPVFSSAALAVMNRQTADPAAVSSYDVMSGGLHWSDEFDALTAQEKNTVLEGWAFRYLLGYRASITLGEERAEFRPVWEQVSEHAPNWPGLRPERWGENARRRLLAAQRGRPRCVEDLDELERELGPAGTT
jgi:hypothetical protein